jgi:hypothetical protein
MCKNISVRYKNVKRGSWKLDKTGEQCFFGAKLPPESNDVTVYKDFFHGKHGTISSDFEGKQSKFPEFYDNF